MHYVISDIHGCYSQYKDLMAKINLKPTDTLYILGDVVDRGPEPMKILLDMSGRDNVIPLMGNHEEMAIPTLTKMYTKNISYNEKAEFVLRLDISSRLDYEMWYANGGKTTMDSFLKLSLQDRHKIIKYLSTFKQYTEVQVNNMDYILIHAGFPKFEFSPNKPLSEYEKGDFLWARLDYSKTYFTDKYIVTGHTPTPNIEENNKGEIIIRNKNIAIDCGCVYGFRLAAFCLETQKAIYSQ